MTSSCVTHHHPMVLFMRLRNSKNNTLSTISSAIGHQFVKLRNADFSLMDTLYSLQCRYLYILMYLFKVSCLVNHYDDVIMGINHQPHDCLLNRLFRRRSKKISKLRVTGLFAGNSPGTG